MTDKRGKMKIQTIKEELNGRFEAEDDRAGAYTFLKRMWCEYKTPALAALIFQQMIDYLLWLDMGSPQEKWEYNSYRSLLVDVVNYGSLKYLDDKHFLWLIIFYLSGHATYYWLLDTAIAKRGPIEDTTKELWDHADQLFSESIMFHVIPDIRCANSIWINSLSLAERKKLKSELTELNLQNNAVDEEFKNWFQYEQLEQAQ